MDSIGKTTLTFVDDTIPEKLLNAPWLAALAPAGDPGTSIRLPLYQDAVRAGWPSPAAGYEEARLDLNEHIIQRPEATFLLRVQGRSMEGAKISEGDVLVCDRAITPVHGHVVIAEVNGDFCVKTLWKRGGTVKLLSANPKYPPITFEDGSELVIFGVVTWILHKTPS